LSFPACASETISAVTNGNAIALHLSTQVALKLGLRLKNEDRLSIGYGMGGTLKLSRSKTDAAIPTYPIDGGVGMNINPKFLINAGLPSERVVLPHDLRGFYVLVDVSPLRIKI